MIGDARRPLLSVIVPAHNDGRPLQSCLDALCASRFPRGQWELIVVDDASDDDTVIVAAQYADTVVRLAGPAHGPGYARNRGFEGARADIVVFVHPWVTARPETLGAIAEAFQTAPELSALTGICDIAGGSSLASRYAELLVAHACHSPRAGGTAVFWSGCGAVRRHVFNTAGGFDEWHGQESWTGDLDLTLRLVRRGYSVQRDGRVRATFTHRWTALEVLTSVLWRRAFAAAWSLPLGATVTGRVGRRAEAGSLVALGAAFVLLALGGHGGGAIVTAAGIASLGAMFLFDLEFLRFAANRGGLRLVATAALAQIVRCTVIGIATLAGWTARALVGPPKPPVTLEALAAAGVSTWPPAPVPPRQRDR
ncbi:MAG TPA: glycosyltransferase family 2 protein [Longimicrobiales bacterium]|nr:glycosyltransferase family 2 protein [Longimicrobiales bacterium]